MVALHENTRRGGEGVAQRVCDTDNRHPRRTAHGTQAPTSSKSPAINSTLTNDLFSNNQNKISFILPLPFFYFILQTKSFYPMCLFSKGVGEFTRPSGRGRASQMVAGRVNRSLCGTIWSCLYPSFFRGLASCANITFGGVCARACPMCRGATK